MLNAVSNLITVFMNELDRTGVSLNTKRSISTDLKQLPAFMKVKSRSAIGELSQEDLVEYILRGEVGEAAIARRTWSLNKFFAFLEKNKHIQINPLGSMQAAELARGKRAQKKSYRVLALNDISKLLSFGKEKLLAGDPLPYLLFTCLLSGLKPKEISLLVWDQVVLGQAEAYFELASRKIPISAYVSLDDFGNALNFARMYEHRSTVFGFGSGQVWFWMRKYSLENGLDVTARQFRWRYVLDLVASGKTKEEIALLTGTSIENVEKFYPAMVDMAKKAN